MPTPECSNCAGPSREVCEKLFRSSAERILLWSEIVADPPSGTTTDVGVRLDSAAGAKDIEVNRLRLPLHEIHCSSWDDDEFVGNRITTKVAEM